MASTMSPEQIDARLAEMNARWQAQAICEHVWSEPRRANNRFGRRSTSLYETFCQKCGNREYRNGLGRLRREVIDA
jgi:hypothetical protein